MTGTVSDTETLRNAVLGIFASKVARLLVTLTEPSLLLKRLRICCGDPLTHLGGYSIQPRANSEPVRLRFRARPDSRKVYPANQPGIQPGGLGTGTSTLKLLYAPWLTQDHRCTCSIPAGAGSAQLLSRRDIRRR
jgi:hypothetical protein